jgi:hypothetical protein
MTCLCGPAREAAEQGRGIGCRTIWCQAYSDEGHRDTTFYEPPHQATGGGGS